jgi:hypothetical protein
MDDMLKRLAAAKVPFFILNLFEDARIEARWRQRFKRRFNWLRYELLMDEEPVIPTIFDAKGKEPGPKSAIGLFLDCIRMENSYAKLRAWVAKDKDPKVAYRGEGAAKYGRRQLIMWFYRRAIHCRDTLKLLPIMQAWCLTFPETAAPDCSDIVLIMIDMPMEGSGCGMPDNAEDADGAKHKEIKETISLSGTLAGAKGGISTPRKEEEEERKHEGKASGSRCQTRSSSGSSPFAS